MDRLPAVRSERHLAAPSPAGARALGDGLVGRGERLAQPLAELAGGLARAATARADDPFAAVFRVPGQAREQEGEDQQDDAEGDDSSDDHALAVPAWGAGHARRASSGALAAGGLASKPGPARPTGARSWTSSRARSHSSRPAARSQALSPCR